MRPTDDGLRTYLNEIARNAVLSKEQEVGLFQRLGEGDPGAREEIIQCNLRLVISIANQFMGRGLPFEDLVQEGNIGLLEVIDKFDWRRGFRFSTYAAFWIRQAIQQALRKQANLIRLPVRKTRLLGNLSETIMRYRNGHWREPTLEELAAAMRMTEENMLQLMRAREGALSLDEERANRRGSLRDTIPAPQSQSPVERLACEEIEIKVGAVLRHLTERERRILRLRFGLNNGKALSLRSTSRLVGLSQEGVRRIEQRALSKLRRPAISRKVADLL